MHSAKLAIRSIVLVLVLLTGVSAPAQAAIVVVPDPGARASDVRNVQQTVDSFNQIDTQEMKFPLLKDVSIYVCPNRGRYAEALENKLGMPKETAKRAALVTDGTSAFTEGAVALLFDPARPAEARYIAYHITGHELMHHLQYQLTGPRYVGTLFWLREGSAGLMGALVAEKNGFHSLARWKLDRLDTLRKAPKHVTPEEIMHPTLEEWTGFMEYGKHPYEVAELMVIYLTGVAAGNVYEGIVEYFELAAYNEDDAAVFQQSFGITLADSNQGFQRWLNQALAAKGK